MSHCTLIVFSGTDGAGKSTQIDLLVSRFRAHHVEPVVLWTRIGYSPGMERIRRLARRILGNKMIPPPGQSEARDRAMRRPGIRRIWLTLSMLDLIWRWGWMVRWYRWCGRVVICDRYWLDSDLDLRLQFSDDRAADGWLWKCVVACCPRPDLAFLLRIPLEDYRQRSIQKREPFPLSDDEFQARWRHYESAASVRPWIELNGLDPPDRLAEEIADRCGLLPSSHAPASRP